MWDPESLIALSETFKVISGSTAAYELKDWAISKVSGKLPAIITDIISESTPEALKADTLIVSQVFEELALADVYNDGIQLLPGGPTHLANVVRLVFSMEVMEGREAKFFELAVS